MLGKLEGKRRMRLQRMRWLNGIMNSIDMSLSKHCETMKEGQEGVKNLPTNAGDLRDMGSIPGLGRSAGGGHSNTLQ